MNPPDGLVDPGNGGFDPGVTLRNNDRIGVFGDDTEGWEPVLHDENVFGTLGPIGPTPLNVQKYGDKYKFKSDELSIEVASWGGQKKISYLKDMSDNMVRDLVLGDNVIPVDYDDSGSGTIKHDEFSLQVVAIEVSYSKIGPDKYMVSIVLVSQDTVSGVKSKIREAATRKPIRN